MLNLSSHEPFAIGGRRACYVAPDAPDQCVKVLRADRSTRARLSGNSWVPAAWRRAYDNNADEQHALESLQRRLGPGITSQHLPLCHGVCATDLGPGLRLDLIRDPDGAISRDLRHHARAGARAAEFRPAFEAFGAWLLEHRVMTRVLHDHNLVAQKQAGGGWRLVLIDGIGDRAWIPLRRWVAPAARRAVRQRLATGWPRIEERFARAAQPAADSAPSVPTSPA